MKLNKKIIIGAAMAASVVIILFLFVGYFGVLDLANISHRKNMALQTGAEAIHGSDISSYNVIRSPSSKSDSIAVNGRTNQMYETANIVSGAGYVTPDYDYSDQNKFDDMYFLNYGTNVFIDPQKDPLSTFSLDVDTSSFTIAKSYIMRGELPPTDAIRPEEFINYFDYDYTIPEDDFSINTELAKSPFQEDSEKMYLLQIGVQSFEDENRKDAALTFVVDVSGSMSTNNRIGLVKKSLTYLVGELREGDSVAIIKYNTNAELILSHTDISEKQKILDAIDTLSPGGSTNAEAGLLLGYFEAGKMLEEDAGYNEKTHRVILLSDGVANVGNTGPDDILKQIESYKEKGIAITTVGVGMGNYNDVLLEQLADKGDGNYYYINDYNVAKRIFGSSLSGTLQTIAKDTKVQVEFNSDVVESYRLVGYENRDIADQDFRNDSVDAGEIGVGHSATAIYEIKMKPYEHLSDPRKIANVILRYKDPDSETVKEISKEITIRDIKSNFESATNEYKKAITVARFAQILKMTQPPPQIQKVDEILNSIIIEESENSEIIENSENSEETELLDMVHNAKRLIEIRQEQNNGNKNIAK